MTDLQKTIRKAQPADTERILAIYEMARAYMRSTGNPGQWKNGYPGRDQLARDMQKGASYVCLAGDCIAGTFYFAVENEPSYASIRGSWLNDEPYGLIHRLAVAVPKCGIAAFCLQWCFAAFPNIRIDTHRDNIPMRHLLEKHGFSYCGIIFLADGSERLAYQKTAGRNRPPAHK